jgi:energy-coupling factor transporter ATP-binding protein EcfA2
MELSIEKLFFGVPAAERDDDLIACFVTSETYNKLAKGQKTIILGNRGSGKSALFRKLADDEKVKGNIIVQLAPEEYSYELLSQSMRKEKEGSWVKQGAYAAAWKYLILVTVMKAITRTGKRFKHGQEARIYNYLRDHHYGVDSSPIGMLVSYLKRMEGVKIGGYEAGIKVRELKKLYSLEEITPFIVDIENICAKKKVFVLVDELDRGWDASEDAVAFVAGLFQAAVSLNSQLANIRVLLSLRKELYDNIPALYDDAQKVRDIIETVEWDEPRILELIARRISNKFKEMKDFSFEDVWNCVFKETLEYRQTKSFNYMVDRTLYRPREIIQFCNDIAEKVRSQLFKEALPFDYKQVAEAEYNYSEGRLKDICSEYRFQYPGLQSVMETFRGKSYNYTKDELEEHIFLILLGNIPVSQDARSWCEILEPENLIDILWHVGLIRAQAVGGLKARRRSGSSYLGSHQISSLNLRNIQRFHIHPMFRAYLGLKESKG